MKTYKIGGILLVSALALSACGKKLDIQKPDVTQLPPGMERGPGLFSGKSGNLMDAFKGNQEGGAAAVALNVNPFLWRSSLEAVSFLPLAEVDSTGGVITTDWGKNPQNANEQVKINILILGRALTPQSLKVNIFKQQKSGDKWQDVAVSEATVTQLEDSILTNARRLRVKEKASQ